MNSRTAPSFDSFAQTAEIMQQLELKGSDYIQGIARGLTNSADIENKRCRRTLKAMVDQIDDEIKHLDPLAGEANLLLLEAKRGILIEAVAALAERNPAANANLVVAA